MIIELRTLLPAREGEESPQRPGKNTPGEKHEETPLVDVEIRSAAAPPPAPASVSPDAVSYPASLPAPVGNDRPAGISDAVSYPFSLPAPVGNDRPAGASDAVSYSVSLPAPMGNDRPAGIPDAVSCPASLPAPGMNGRPAGDSDEVSYPASFPGTPLVPENSPSPAFEGAGTFSDDRIPELLERLLEAAERSAAFSEQIADSLERQSAVSGPVYA